VACDDFKCVVYYCSDSGILIIYGKQPCHDLDVARIEDI
jgi:hypothetical protein